MLKKSDVLREGYMQGLKKAQSIINEMIKQSEDELPENTIDVMADNDEDAIYQAEWHEQREITAYDKIEYGDDDGTTWARISGIVWGKSLK